jgi:hypothetical protein
VGLKRSALRVPIKTPEKLRQSTTSPMWGAVTPADRYELWPVGDAVDVISST